MQMDWGDADRSVRRARFYGKGNVLLFLTHPKRARTVIRLWPDTIAYPLWIIVLVFLLPLATVAAWLPAAWLSLLAVPLARNRRAPDLGALMRVKFERAISFLTGWVTVPLHRDLPVVMVPENHENPYLDELCAGLDVVGVASRQLGLDTTSSQTLNALLALPRIVWLRIRGVRVLHLHWTYLFAWPWADRLVVVRLLPRLWFTTVLAVARGMGMRIVFTAHNVLPHHRVFDDDRAARAALLARSDQVITLTTAARERVSEEFSVPPSKISVIPEGTPRLAPPAARAHRQRERLVAFGHLEEYKGVDLLVEAASLVARQRACQVELMGTASDPAYKDRLEEALAHLRSDGVEASWADRRFSDEELVSLLARADLAAFPFRAITNSTSLRVAMASRVVCVVPELPALCDVPRDAALRFTPGDVADLARAIVEGLGMDADARSSMLDAASAWLDEWSWERVARATRTVYERALT
jgi:glycosyltransferase involved in cell wall biosynthesis